MHRIGFIPLTNLHTQFYSTNQFHVSQISALTIQTKVIQAKLVCIRYSASTGIESKRINAQNLHEINC